MGNSYFKFKQFTIQQDKCAMKVCTDACLFGSIAALIEFNKPIANVLDIGTGTGLLPLMYAQKNSHVTIDSVEIDEAAAQQAYENFAASPWSEKLRVHHSSIQQFSATNNRQFDLIISNPPFFDNDLRSDDEKRNLALHSSELSLQELLNCIDMLLYDDGVFGVLLPYHRGEYFKSLTTGKGFSLWKDISVRQTPKHNYFRCILFFTRRQVEVITESIVIKEADNNYSVRFTELLRDYYLYL